MSDTDDPASAPVQMPEPGPTPDEGETFLRPAEPAGGAAQQRWGWMREQRREATEADLAAGAVRKETAAIQEAVLKLRGLDAQGYFEVRRIGPPSLPQTEIGRVCKIRLDKLGKKSLDDEIEARCGGGEYQAIARRADHSVVPGGDVMIDIAGTPTMVSDQGREWQRRAGGVQPAKADDVDQLSRLMEVAERMGLSSAKSDSSSVALMLQKQSQDHEKWMAEEKQRRDEEREERRRKDEAEREERARRDAERMRREDEERAVRAKRDEEEREERKRRWESEQKEAQRRHERQLAEDKARFDLQIKQVEENNKRTLEMMKLQSQDRRDAQMLDPKKLKDFMSDLAITKLKETAGISEEDEPSWWQKLLSEHGGKLIEAGVDIISSRAGVRRPPAEAVAATPTMLPDPAASAPADADVEAPAAGEPPAPDAGAAAPAPTGPQGPGQQDETKALAANAATSAAISVSNFTRVLSVEMLAQRTPMASWEMPQDDNGTSLADLYERMPEPARLALQRGWMAFRGLVPPPGHSAARIIDDLLTRHPKGVEWMRSMLSIGPWAVDDDEGEGEDIEDIDMPKIPPGEPNSGDLDTGSMG